MNEHIVKQKQVKQNTEKPYGFTLEFHFEDNEYFKNKVLTKTYEFAYQKDKRNPLLSTPNALYKCVGCKIDWKEGKSPIKEGAEDEEDDERRGGTFFDFFSTHTADGVRPSFKEREKDNKKDKKNGGGGDDEEEDDDDDIENLFELDYEIGLIC